MNTEEIIRRTVEGRQNSSLEYMKRFSLCDCMSIHFKDTYTAMGAGVELFLEKFSPGEKFLMPYVNKLPPQELIKMRPVGYKIPKKIDTFLWSPFHEGTSQYYDLGDGIKYSFRLKGGFLVKYGVAKRCKTPTEKELLDQIKEMDKKIDKIWPRCNKIIILYEQSRMQDDRVRGRLDSFTEKSLKLLEWPTIQMKLTKHDAKKPQKKIGKDERGIVWNGWEHYSKQAYDLVEEQINTIERQNNNVVG